MKPTEKLLLINACNVELYVALVAGDRVVEERFCAETRSHDRNINRLVKGLLDEASAVAVVTGTGSWTGSRVGVVAGKSYAMALQMPLIALHNDEREKIIITAREKFDKKDFTNYDILAPFYESDFKVTPPKK